ncbi:MAG: hypothetical protein ICV69_15640 [Thermoleophilaceae bacterium]|nr:hypothetical protein [Thermoleophilaceae bacterium]
MCLLTAAGILVLSGAEGGAAFVVAGAASSRALVLLSFHSWLLAAAALDVAIMLVALR